MGPKQVGARRKEVGLGPSPQQVGSDSEAQVGPKQVGKDRPAPEAQKGLVQWPAGYGPAVGNVGTLGHQPQLQQLPEALFRAPCTKDPPAAGRPLGGPSAAGQKPPSRFPKILSTKNV